MKQYFRAYVKSLMIYEWTCKEVLVDYIGIAISRCEKLIAFDYDVR